MKNIVRYILLVASLAACLPVFALGHTYVVRSRASKFLAEIRILRPGKASLRDVKDLEQRYRTFVITDDKSCTDSYCEVAFNFDNRWLARLHMAPGTVFAAGLRTTGDRVSEVSIGLDAPPAYFTDLVEVVGEATSVPYKLNGTRATSGPTQYSLNIELTTSAPEEIRQRAYSFNLGCLTKLGGCHDARQMLPQVQIPE